MFRFLSDQNFNNDIVRGLLLRSPDLNVVRTQDVGLDEVEDPEVLVWAAKENRLTLTHDRSTFPPAAFDRVIAGQPMPGVIVVHDRLPVGRAIDELLVVVGCSRPEEWANKVLYLPL